MLMARMNISVPDELKNRMDNAGNGENWSAIACTAFEIRLGEIAKLKQEKEMSDVIQRLRASKKSRQTEAFSLGEKLGYQWARDRAEFDELERVLDFEGDKVDAFDRFVTEGAYDLWDSLCVEPEDIKRDGFLDGFIDGVTRLYNEVADAL